MRPQTVPSVHAHDASVSRYFLASPSQLLPSTRPAALPLFVLVSLARWKGTRRAAGLFLAAGLPVALFTLGRRCASVPRTKEETDAPLAFSHHFSIFSLKLSPRLLHSRVADGAALPSMSRGWGRTSNRAVGFFSTIFFAAPRIAQNMSPRRGRKSRGGPPGHPPLELLFSASHFLRRAGPLSVAWAAFVSIFVRLSISVVVWVGIRYFR
jgi:hypothetical protein